MFCDPLFFRLHIFIIRETGNFSLLYSFQVVKQADSAPEHLPDLGCGCYQKVADVNHRQHSAPKLRQRLLKAGARGDVQLAGPGGFVCFVNIAIISTRTDVGSPRAWIVHQ